MGKKCVLNKKIGSAERMDGNKGVDRVGTKRKVLFLLVRVCSVNSWVQAGAALQLLAVNG